MRPRLKPFLDALAEEEITVWPDWSRVQGLAAVDGETHLNLQQAESAEDLAATATHEIVHRVREDLYGNEPAIDAIAVALMARPAWRRAIFERIAQALFEVARRRG